MTLTWSMKRSCNRYISRFAMRTKHGAKTNSDKNVKLLNYKFTIPINVIENGSDNQEWTTQRHWQYWAHKTQDDDRQNIKTQHNTEN